MSTKEKINGLLALVNPDDLELIYQIIERFALTSEIPNEETLNAMLEADAIAKDPNVKGYSSVSQLMEALDAE